MSFKPKQGKPAKKVTNFDGVVVYIDGDMLAFMCASANEKASIEVTHKSNPDKVLTFKSRTEFIGRSKVHFGGKVKIWNDKLKASGKKPYERKDFTITDVYEVADSVHVKHSIKNRINEILGHLGAPACKIVMGEGENFRHRIPLPKKYKHPRNDARRPDCLPIARRYIEEVYDTEVCHDIEADDRLSMIQYQGWENKLDNGLCSTLVVAVDKDALQTNGMLFNPATVKGIFTKPDIMNIQGLGKLYLSPKKEVKGHGRAWLYYQIAYGDKTDGYHPTAYFDKEFDEEGKQINKIKSFGPLTILEKFIDCETDAEYLQQLVYMYQESFPNGVQYTSHCGQEMDITAIEWMQMIADCAFMQRWPDDRFNVQETLDKLEINYA
ncbi:hypothetical protein N9937_02365 [bacterium]|nr:hypothetical protein [bacterium]